MRLSTSSRLVPFWQSNLNLPRSSSFLLLGLLLILSIFGVVAAAEDVSGLKGSAAESSPASPPRETAKSIAGLVKFLYNTAVNGPDNSAQYTRDQADGVERLTDEDYVRRVEYLFDGGSEDQVWIVLVHGRPNDPTSDAYLDAHSEAAKLAKSDESLSKFRWARLDYIAEWEICTKWLLMRPPYVVFISDKGRTLRFLKPSNLRPDPQILYDGIKSGNWETVPVWESRWAPGGDRAFLVEWYIKLSAHISRKTSKIPSWLLMAGGGIVAQQILSWLHGGSSGSTATATAQARAGAAAARRAAGAGAGAASQPGQSIKKDQ
ncbi:hypothetical protein I317_02384 [Kwoniella heveanensis CBS 569]|nr:hypothetical protein I317_02384 [Kwoniella heveanensis CBS 569]